MAGKINLEWLDDARGNESPDETIEDLIATAGNYASVEIDGDGSVSATPAHTDVPVWLSQEAIDQAVKLIDAGLV